MHIVIKYILILDIILFIILLSLNPSVLAFNPLSEYIPDIDDFSQVHDNKVNLSELPQINADENHSRVILKALSKIDEDVVSNILSISVVDINEVGRKCGARSIGCAGPAYNNNIITGFEIYVAHMDDFKEYCNTFEHTLYHEIGHVAYYISYEEIKNVNNEREMEYWVDDYADKYKKDEDCPGKSLRLFH